MAVSVIETIKSRANAGNTAYIVVVKLLCDDYSDLPTQSGLSGYELAQGCIAHVINENKDYMIDSSGNWHVYGGDSWTNVYTKSETDALLDDKQDELTTAQLDAVNSGITAAKVQQYDDTVTDGAEDRAALVELIDGGAKNVVQTNDVTQTGNGFVNTDPISGNLFISAATVSTTASSSTFAIVFYYTDGTISPTQQLPITNSLVYGFNANNKVVERVRIFAGNTTEASSGKTITLTNFMICTAADWAISQKFVPYCPSMQEMYQMILALQ